MPSDSRFTTSYFIYIAATGVATLFSALYLLPADVVNVLVFFAFAVAAEAFPIPVPPLRGSISLGFVAIFATILSEGPLWGTIIASLATVRPLDFAGQVSLRGVIYNRFQLGVSALLSAYTYHAMSSGAAITAWQSILGFVVASLVYFAVNVLLFSLYVYKYKGVKVLQVVRHLKTTGMANYIALMPLAYLIAAIQQWVGPIGMLLFLLPLVVARFSFKRFIDVQQMFLNTIRALALALEAKDRYTYGHADRVARLSVEIGKALNLSDMELEQLQYAGILHDIGKIGVRDEILNKPGRYTPDEYEEMKKHPVIGARIVSGIDSLETVSLWIRHHHERYDGGGYPDGLKGDEIPLGSRIIAVADAFDAMLYDRPYKAGRPLPEVIEELKQCSGSHFDPQIVKVVLELVSRPEQVAELTRPPELKFIEYLASIYGLRPPVPAVKEDLLVLDEVNAEIGVAEEPDGSV